MVAQGCVIQGAHRSQRLDQGVFLQVFSASSSGLLRYGQLQVRCALGKGGVIAAAAKREGDGASPIGVWPIRRIMWRADKMNAPQTSFGVTAIQPDDGWCDSADDAS